MRVRTLPGALVTVAGIALLGGGLALGSPAGAAPAGSPQSGDPRATAYAGNATTCEDAGLAGDIIAVSATTDATNTYVTITGVPDGVTLTGVVVKGGPAYNVYVGDQRTQLHAPLVSSGKPAQISHWFACGAPNTTTSGPPPTTSAPPTTTAPPTTNEAPTTTAGAVQPAVTPPTSGQLATTGAPLSTIAGLGALLVLAGAVMLLVPRLRRRRLGQR